MARKQKVTEAVGVRLDYMRLSDLRAYPGNPKKHAQADLLASLERFGFLDPIGLDAATGQIVEGHGRTEALFALKSKGAPPPRYIETDADGEWLVPVLQGLAFTSPEEAKAYLLAHNQVALQGGWDKGKLAALLSDQQVALAGLDGIGFSQEDIAALLAEALPPPIDDPDARPSLLDALTTGKGLVPSTPAAPASREAHEPPPAMPSIKALVLQYDRETYERIVARLSGLMEAQRLDSHTAVFEYLLARFEKKGAA